MRRALLQAGQKEEADALPKIITLDVLCAPFLLDFNRLSTTRAGGMGILPISWLNVEQYAHICGYDGFMTYFLHRVVESLDPIYMTHVNEKLKST